MWELKIDSYIPKNLKIKKEKKVREKKICKNTGCNNPVKMRGTKAKYCSLKCSAESNKKWKIRICKNCNNEYQSTRQRKSFCSKKCYGESIKIKRVCQNPECNSIIKKSTKKSRYCSFECYNKMRSKHIIRISHCQYQECGNELTEIQRKNYQKYCGKECYKEDRRKQIKSLIGNKISLRKRSEWTYPKRFIKTDKGWIMLSRYTWEKSNGPIPPKHYVGFKDGDSFNDQDIDNLYLRKFKDNLKSRKR